MPENQYEIMVGYYKEMLSYFKTLGDWAKASSDIKALVNWARRRDIKITRLSVKSETFINMLYGASFIECR